MKIAMCLYGVIGGTSTKAGDGSDGNDSILEIGYNHYRKYFFEKYDVDVFIHTWSVDYEERVRSYYKPVKAIFQKQKIFTIPEYAKVPKGFENRKQSRIQNHYSRWYSTKKVVQLKKEYENENDFKYDFVFLTRFDVAFFKSINFKKLNSEFFYLAPWCFNKNILGNSISNRRYYNFKAAYPFPLSITFHKHKKYPYEGGVADLWFISNTTYMDVFSTLYNYLDQYLHKIEVSNHKLAQHHLINTGLINNIYPILHRFKDFALIRRKFFKAKK